MPLWFIHYVFFAGYVNAIVPLFDVVTSARVGAVIVLLALIYHFAFMGARMGIQRIHKVVNVPAAEARPRPCSLRKPKRDFVIARKHYTDRERMETVKKFRASGLPLSGYARENGLVFSTLRDLAYTYEDLEGRYCSYTNSFEFQDLPVKI